MRIDRQDLTAAPVGERPRVEAVAKTVTAVLMVVLLVAAVALTVAGFR